MVNGIDTKLHRLLMNFPQYPFQVDHINGDTLDNRRVNLRVVHRSINAKNRIENRRRLIKKGQYLIFIENCL